MPSSFCSDIDDEETCQVKLASVMHKIKNERTRSLCKKAAEEEIFKKK